MNQMPKAVATTETTPLAMVARMARDEPDAQGRGDDGNDSVGDGGGQRRLGAKAGGLQDDRGEIHEGVDAGELDHEAQSDPDQQQAADPRLLQMGPAGRLFAIGRRRDHGRQFALARFLILTDAAQDPARLVLAIVQCKPARRFRHGQHAQPQQRRRHRRHRQHDAPDTVIVDRDRQNRASDIGDELARDDHHLGPGDKPGAPVGRCHLGDEDRNDGRGAADPQPQQEPHQHHHRDIGRPGRAERAEKEDERQHQQRPAPAVAIRKAARDQRSDRRTENQRRGDKPLGDGIQSQPAL
nr:hypothetical protein [Sinirhodobacter populi]